MNKINVKKALLLLLIQLNFNKGTNKNLLLFGGPTGTTIAVGISIAYLLKHSSHKKNTHENISPIESHNNNNTVINLHNYPNPAPELNNNKNKSEDVIEKKLISQEVALIHPNPFQSIQKQIAMEQKLALAHKEKLNIITQLKNLLAYSHEQNKDKKFYLSDTITLDTLTFNLPEQKKMHTLMIKDITFKNTLFVPALYNDPMEKPRHIAFTWLIKETGKKTLEKHTLYFYRDIIEKLTENEQTTLYAFLLFLTLIHPNNIKDTIKKSLNTLPTIKKMLHFKIYYDCEIYNSANTIKKTEPKNLHTEPHLIITKPLTITFPRHTIIQLKNHYKQLLFTRMFTYNYLYTQKKHTQKNAQKEVKKILFFSEHDYVHAFQQSQNQKKIQSAALGSTNNTVLSGKLNTDHLNNNISLLMYNNHENTLKKDSEISTKILPSKNVIPKPYITSKYNTWLIKNVFIKILKK